MARIETGISRRFPRRAQHLWARQLAQDHGGCVRADAGDRDQPIVPGLQVTILRESVFDRPIERGDFRFQLGDHLGHGGVGHSRPLARAAPVGPLHP
jgi:hypothetical protein